jgi:hypothetical protein
MLMIPNHYYVFGENHYQIISGKVISLLNVKFTLPCAVERSLQARGIVGFAYRNQRE